MKKISVLLTMVMIMALLASCGSKSNKVKPDETIEEKNVVTIKEKPAAQEVVVTEEPTAEEIVTEEPANNAEAKAEEWSCEANVSENDDGTLTVDYVITDSEGKTTHSFSENPDFDKSWYEMYSDIGEELYEFADFNFDGYLDIRTQQYGAMVNQYYNIRIWNESISEFELNQEYMELPNPVVNVDKKQIFTTNFDRGLGNFALYEVKDDVLTEIATIDVTIKENGSFEYIETIGNKEGKGINSVEEIDAIWDDYNVFIE